MKLQAGREVEVEVRPMCDLCGAQGRHVPASIDGKLKAGPWAYVCELHAELEGVTLGVGYGQRLIVNPR